MADTVVSINKTGTINSGALLYTAPFNTYYHDNRIQYLIYSSELKSCGLVSGDIIKGLSLHASENSGRPLANFRIRITETSSTSITSFVTTGFTLCYQISTFNAPTAGNWYEFLFSTNYIWNGSNIIIDITRDDSGYKTGGGNYYYEKIDSNTRLLGGRADSAQTYPFDNMSITSKLAGTILETKLRYEHPDTPVNPSNNAPEVPTFRTPTEQGYTINKRPIIQVNVPSDADGHNVQINVTIKKGTTTIDTLTSSFVPQGTGYVNLTPSVDLPTGLITFTAYAYDGTNSSGTTSLTIGINPSTSSITTLDCNISKSDIDNLNTLLQNARLFRGLDGSNYIETITSNKTAIKAIHLTTMRSKLTEVLNILGISPVWTDPVIVPNKTKRSGRHWIEIYNYLKQS